LRAEEQAVRAAGMRYVSVPMQGIVGPTEEQMVRILPLLFSGQPVFVHCKRGKDRTGTVIAAYRILKDGWDNSRALKEAKSLGMSFIQVGMKHYIQNLRPSDDRVIAGGAATAPATQER